MDNRILEKIKKCLALAKSDNANEAATALRQAQALMHRHGVNSETLALSEISACDVAAGAGKTPPRWIAMLMNFIGLAFGVEAIYKATRNRYLGPYKGTVEFIGFDSAPQIAQYAYEVLLRQLKRGRENFLDTQNKRLKRETLIRRGDLYAEGWIEAVYNKINPRKMHPEKEALIKKWKAEQHPNLQQGNVLERTSKAKHHDQQSYGQGFSDGKKVEFNQGVGADKRDALAHQEV